MASQCKCEAGFRVFTVMPDTPKAAEVNWLCAGTGERHVLRLIDVDRVPGGEMDGRALVFEPTNPDGGATIFCCDAPPGGIEELRAKMDDAMTKLYDTRSDGIVAAAALVKETADSWFKMGVELRPADIAALLSEILKLRA